MKLVKSRIALRPIVTAPSHKRLQSFVALPPRVTEGSFRAFATLRFSRPIPAFLPRLPRLTGRRPGQARRRGAFPVRAISPVLPESVGLALGRPPQRPEALRGEWALSPALRGRCATHPGRPERQRRGNRRKSGRNRHCFETRRNLRSLRKVHLEREMRPGTAAPEQPPRNSQGGSARADQLGRLGGDTCAESDVLAEVISRSIRVRSASSACWSRRNCADARWAAAGVLADTMVATSV